MRDAYTTSHVTTYKEEMPARLKPDAIDRDRVRTSLETCIDPLSTAEHPEHIVNVVSGRIS